VSTLFATPGSGKTITYLSGCIRREALGQRPDFGVLMTPLMGNRPQGIGVFALDNGVYTEFLSKGKKPFSLARFLGLLDKWKHVAHQALFATAPDVVGDWQGSIERSLPVLPLIRDLGYRAAFVAQNGLERHLNRIPWDEFDVLFLGGGPEKRFISKLNRMGEWKLSDGGRRLCDKALALGKTIHMGRVNSGLRLGLAQTFGCASADGTCIGRHPKGPTFATAEVISWLDRFNGPALQGAAA